MFGFVIALVVNIWMAIISRALTRPKISDAGDVTVPRTDEGTAIAAVFGTVQLAPNIVWWGDAEPVPIKGPRRVFGLAGPRDTIGYRYYAGMQGALCWGPVDALVEIVVAEKYLLSEEGPSTTRVVAGAGYTTTVSDATTPGLPIAYAAAGQLITVSAADLFGGKEVEGGLLGDLRFYFGSTTQGENAYLASQPDLASDFPHYKGLCYAVWEHMYLGTVPYLKPWHFVVRRCPGALGVLASDTSLSRIGDDANPAEVLYELWTDTRWGLGESAAALDVPSFLTALQTLYDEGLGISGVVASSAEDTVKEILRTIEGALVEDPLTGKLKLSLIRADYTVADLETFTPSNSARFTVTRGDWDTLASEVKVTYTDAAQRFTTRTRAAYNGAVRQITRARGIANAYPLISTAANAEALAFRDLHAVSTPLASGSVTVARIGSALAVGDPFILDYPDRGLPETVVRVTRADYGTINGRETVEIDWAQDVFGVPGGVYVGAGDDAWTPITPTNDGTKFDVDADFVLSTTQGCLTLEITGDISAITLVETQTQEGGAAAGAWTTQDNSAPITVCVDRDDRETGFVAYRITYTESDGTSDTLTDSFAVPLLGADDGNAEGTPGNLVVTLSAGSPIIISAWPSAVTRIAEFDVTPFPVNLGKVGSIKIAVPVIVAGPAGAKIGVRALAFVGGGWEFLNVAGSGPNIDADAVNESDGVVLAVNGDWVEIDSLFLADNIQLEVVAFGGDDATDGVIGNVYVTATSADTATVPPSGTPDPPEIPTTDPTLLALWPVDEEAGLVAADATGNGHTLVLGLDSPDDQDPTWFGAPTRGLLFGPASGLHLKYAWNQTLPWSGGELRALSLAFYLRFSSLPAGEAWLFRLTSTGGGELQIRLKPSGELRLARGTDGTDPDITTAVLSANTDYMVAVTCGSEIGDTMTVSVNAGTPVTSSAFDGQVAAFLTQPKFYWGADNEGFTGQIGFPGIIGKTAIADGVWSADQVAGIYANFRLDYPGLPVP
jgi:hypothetical protein